MDEENLTNSQIDEFFSRPLPDSDRNDGRSGMNPNVNFSDIETESDTDDSEDDSDFEPTLDHISTKRVAGQPIPSQLRRDVPAQQSPPIGQTETSEDIDDPSSTDSEDFVVRRIPGQASAASHITAGRRATAGRFSPPSTSRRVYAQPEQRHANAGIEERYAYLEWTEPKGNHKDFPFTGNSGMKPEISGLLAMADPVEYFRLFLDDDLLDMMVHQTNLYATQTLLASNPGPSSRLHQWDPTNKEELLRFLALLGWMGVVKVPRLKDYWSTNDQFSFPFPKSVMSRNRFELLLRFWHFSDNELPEASTDRLHKLKPLIDKLVSRFREHYTPSARICIDESLIPFRGRLIFRQYIPNKKARYGVKLFKLCTESGYTYNLTAYSGKRPNQNVEISKTEETVMTLLDGLLNEGRTLFMDNYYNSIPLAYKLLENKTHLVGTLRKNRKFIPNEINERTLKKGDLISKESPDGVTIVKWKDQRDVLMISTKHLGNETKEVKTRKGTIQKPTCILDYDEGKYPVDVSDQLSSYNSSLRKTTKWYKKTAIELLWGTASVNAYHLYTTNSVHNNKNMHCTDFRMKVIQGLISHSPPPPPEPEPNQRKRSSDGPKPNDGSPTY